MNGRRLVRVPASSANLGPGFDVLAAALSPALTVEVEETGTFAVETDLDVPRDNSNLVVRAFETLHPADGFTFRIAGEIPLVGGLGSSAAAIVAGVAAADHIFELGVDLQAAASEIEGHPDNVAAALQGGFVVCGAHGVTRIEPPAGLEAVLAIPPPSHTVVTADARAALPAQVPLADAVANLSSIANLALGLERSDWALIGQGLDDCLHQPQRAGLYSDSFALVQRARDLGAIGATISGAGPTVLVWSDWETTGDVCEAVRANVATDWDVGRVTFAPTGIDVRVL